MVARPTQEASLFDILLLMDELPHETLVYFV